MLVARFRNFKYNWQLIIQIPIILNKESQIKFFISLCLNKSFYETSITVSVSWCIVTSLESLKRNVMSNLLSPSTAGATGVHNYLLSSFLTLFTSDLSCHLFSPCAYFWGLIFFSFISPACVVSLSVRKWALARLLDWAGCCGYYSPQTVTCVLTTTSWLLYMSVCQWSADLAC